MQLSSSEVWSTKAILKMMCLDPNRVSEVLFYPKRRIFLHLISFFTRSCLAVLKMVKSQGFLFHPQAGFNDNSLWLKSSNCWQFRLVCFSAQHGCHDTWGTCVHLLFAGVGVRLHWSAYTYETEVIPNTRLPWSPLPSRIQYAISPRQSIRISLP